MFYEHTHLLISCQLQHNSLFIHRVKNSGSHQGIESGTPEIRRALMLITVVHGHWYCCVWLVRMFRAVCGCVWLWVAVCGYVMLCVAYVAGCSYMCLCGCE